MHIRNTLVAALAAALLAPCAFAQNSKGGSTGGSAGVIAIDQAKAEAGGVTPGDDPGFPVTISQPGSYRLMGNLNVTAPDQTAIRVSADNVTIDLNGFTITGPGSCSISGGVVSCQNMQGYTSGVDATYKFYVTVRNGKLRGFYQGIRLGHQSTAEGVEVGQAVYGIHADSMSTVARSVVHLASAYGILLNNGAARENSVANAAVGIQVSTGGLIERNRIDSVGTGIKAYAPNSVASAAGNVIRFAAQPLDRVLQMGPNVCDLALC